MGGGGWDVIHIGGIVYSVVGFWCVGTGFGMVKCDGRQ